MSFYKLLTPYFAQFCPICGGKLYWESDFMRSEIEDSELSEEDDAVVGFWTCSQCGETLEVHSLSPNEQKIYEELNEEFADTDSTPDDVDSNGTGQD